MQAQAQAHHPPVPLTTSVTSSACFAHALMQALMALPPVAAYVWPPPPHTHADRLLIALQYLATVNAELPPHDILRYLVPALNAHYVGAEDFFQVQQDPGELFLKLLEAVPWLNRLCEWQQCQYYYCATDGCVGTKSNHTHTAATWLLLPARPQFADAWREAMVTTLDKPCAQCGQALRTAMNLSTQPGVLVLLVERNTYTRRDPTVICWPTTFRVARHNGATSTFELVAAISHMGATVSSGHYLTLVRRAAATANVWYVCDGTAVAPVDEPQQFLQSSVYVPYMLFFVTVE